MATGPVHTSQVSAFSPQKKKKDKITILGPKVIFRGHMAKDWGSGIGPMLVRCLPQGQSVKTRRMESPRRWKCSREDHG